jgi:hypothetical protein
MTNNKPKYFINDVEVINTVKICAYSVRDMEKFFNTMLNYEKVEDHPDIKNNNKRRIEVLLKTLQNTSDLLSKVAYTLEKGK